MVGVNDRPKENFGRGGLNIGNQGVNENSNEYNEGRNARYYGNNRGDFRGGMGRND